MAYTLMLVSVLMTDTQPCSMDRDTSRFVTTAKMKNTCVAPACVFLLWLNPSTSAKVTANVYKVHALEAAAAWLCAWGIKTLTGMSPPARVGGQTRKMTSHFH